MYIISNSQTTPAWYTLGYTDEFALQHLGTRNGTLPYFPKSRERSALCKRIKELVIFRDSKTCKNKSSSLGA